MVTGSGSAVAHALRSKLILRIMSTILAFTARDLLTLIHLSIPSALYNIILDSLNERVRGIVMENAPVIAGAYLLYRI
jgi:hypothetical protein